MGGDGRHSHHLIGNAIRLLLVPVSRRTNRQFRLKSDRRAREGWNPARVAWWRAGYHASDIRTVRRGRLVRPGGRLAVLRCENRHAISLTHQGADTSPWAPRVRATIAWNRLSCVLSHLRRENPPRPP